MKKYLVTIFLLIGVAYANASSVRQVSMEEMAQKSALIFEGTVISVVAHKDEYGAIVTDVFFDVIEVIKGDVSSTPLKLEFLGGEFEGKTMLVTEMHYPALGEKGIYFVESADTPLINPLYGWDQGRYLVKKEESGEESVMSADKKPIESLRSIPSGVMLKNKSVDPMTLSTGVADGVVIQNSSSISILSKEEFKRYVRNLIGLSHEYLAYAL